MIFYSIYKMQSEPHPEIQFEEGPSNKSILKVPDFVSLASQQNS
jgi:hypothetical protein